MNGLLSVDQFDQRYGLIGGAETAAAVQAIVADLEPETGFYDLPIPVESATPTPTPLPTPFRTPLPMELAESIRLPTVLGSTKRQGVWSVPPELHCLVILGELVLDFRDAHFVSDAVTVDLSATLGSVTLIVPPGTQVENECHEILSSSTFPKRGRRSAPPNGLLVVLTGRAFFSDVTVKEKPPASQVPTLRERLGLGS